MSKRKAGNEDEDKTFEWQFEHVRQLISRVLGIECDGMSSALENHLNTCPKFTQAAYERWKQVVLIVFQDRGTKIDKVPVAPHLNSIDKSKRIGLDCTLMHEQQEHRRVNALSFPVRLGSNDSIPRWNDALFRIPISTDELKAQKHLVKKDLKKKLKKFKKASSSHAQTTAASACAFDAEFYLLTPQEMQELKFFAFPPAYQHLVKSTHENIYVPEKHEKVLGLDCEMVKTRHGSELARATLVTTTGKVIYDELVLPMDTVVDHCTQYSGITSEMLAQCTNSFEKVQMEVFRLISLETILVGHSIENDLVALRLKHARVIDTTRLFPHPKGHPYRHSLRHLTLKYLRREIQKQKPPKQEQEQERKQEKELDKQQQKNQVSNGTTIKNDANVGHSSVEDAFAAMQLFQLKLEKGPTFPTLHHQRRHFHMLHEMSKAQLKCVLVDRLESCLDLTHAGLSTIDTIPCSSNAHIETKLKQCIKKVNPTSSDARAHYDFVWCRFENLAHQVDESSSSSSSSSSSCQASESSLLLLNRLWQDPELTLSSNRVFIALHLPSSTRLEQLHTLRTTRLDARSTLQWTASHALELQSEAVAAHRGHLHLFYAAPSTDG